MTYDFQLGHKCPHLTVEEEIPLGSDRRSLVTRQPVASASRMRITANDTYDIPPSGLYSAAYLQGSQAGPFNIPTYAQNLEIKTRTQVLAVVLPTGQRVSSSEVVRKVQAAVKSQGVRIEVTENQGVLGFKDLVDLGPGSTLRVGGDGAERIGFVAQRRARGKEIYPGWGMAEQSVFYPRATTDQQRVVTARYPIFDSPIKGNPILKATYTTYQAFCLRCKSYGVENDYRIGQDGNYLAVRDDDKLNQDGLKALVTIRGSNPYHLEYGSNLLNRIGIKAIGAGVATITEDVTRALTILQRIQRISTRNGLQSLTPKETLQDIVSVVTTPSAFDPTVFEVRVVVRNASADPIVITTVFASAGVAALAGTNGLSLGLTERGVDPSLSTLPGIQ